MVMVVVRQHRGAPSAMTCQLGCWPGAKARTHPPGAVVMLQEWKKKLLRCNTNSFPGQAPRRGDIHLVQRLCCAQRTPIVLQTHFQAGLDTRKSGTLLVCTTDLMAASTGALYNFVLPRR
eukprot:1157767-Pelagomonas_calceolata.AAC.11